MVEILLVDDQKSIRERLKLVLESEPGLKVVGMAEDGAAAIRQVKSLKPDIVILDLEMPKMNGIETTKIINQHFPKSKIIFLTSFESKEYLAQIRHTGVEGILIKGTSEENIIQAIKNFGFDKKKIDFSNNSLIKQAKKSTIFLFLALILYTVFNWLDLAPQTKVVEDLTNTVKPQIKVRAVALGRLVPKGEVIKLSVADADSSRVDQILVEEGERVEKNQVIAILQGFENRKRDLEAAQKTVELAQAKLAQTRAGDTKKAELAAQNLKISRLESKLQNETLEKQAAVVSAEAQLRQAELNYSRNKSLKEDGAVSQQNFDEALERFDMSRASLKERKAQLNNVTQSLELEITQERENLARLWEIRPVDVRVAEIELERAIIAVEQSKADLEDTEVKVPISGQILRINTRVGEQINTQRG
ncbi:MAG: response regulator, partial [Cyanobacteria bacterium J06558_2]